MYDQEKARAAVNAAHGYSRSRCRELSLSLRQELGLTQAQLGDLIGGSEGGVRGGERAGTLEHLVRVATAAGKRVVVTIHLTDE